MKTMYNDGNFNLSVLPLGSSPTAFLDCVMQSLAVSVRAGGFVDVDASKP